MVNKNHFLFYSLGIFISYFYFGIVQEKVTRRTYSYELTDNSGNTTIINEKFSCVLILVFVQCIINYIVAKIALYYWPQQEDKTNVFYYASFSLTYLLAMICSNMALQWVPYPTQVVGKSAKPIPVMILGVLIGKKSYTAKKYLFVFLIVLGVVLFMLKDKASSLDEESSLGIGELLLVLSLIMDGLTGAVQDRIRAESKPSGIQMMIRANEFSSIYLAILILLSGEAFKFIEFANRYPSVISNLFFLGITSSIGQLFLYSMVSEFGPLAVSIVTTTRKFFTVLASVILFGNVLSNRQWLGATIVFSGLFLDAYFGKQPPKVNT